jgi:hypothetical protein
MGRVAYGKLPPMDPVAEACGNLESVLSLWWTQQLDSDCQLWSLSVGWWGRIGKLLAAAGLATLIVEIIGPKKSRRVGKESTRGASPTAAREIQGKSRGVFGQATRYGWTFG